MTPLQQAAQAALSQWDDAGWIPDNSVQALRKALKAEQAQAVEPAFWMNEYGQLSATRGWAERNLPGSKLTPLYTHSAPPAGEPQVPMTDDEIAACMDKAYATVQGRHLERAFARAIEAHHGIGAKP